MNVHIDVEGFEMTEQQKTTLGLFIVDASDRGEIEVHVEESGVFDDQVKVETMDEDTHWYILPNGHLETVS